MKSVLLFISLSLIGLSQVQAAEVATFEKFYVSHSFTSRGSAMLLAYADKVLVTLHCGNSMKSMQILDKQTGMQKTYISGDFYCHNISTLAANLKTGSVVSIRVTTDWRPKLNEPSKMENVVQEVEVQTDDGSVTNAYQYPGDGFGERWIQVL